MFHDRNTISEGLELHLTNFLSACLLRNKIDDLDHEKVVDHDHP